MKKKILIFLSTLCFILNLSLFNTLPTHAEQKIERYIVLVLDTSGEQEFYIGEEIIPENLLYTADSALSYTKQAATKFVSNILDSSDINNIALVEYNDSAQKLADFSKDKNEINSKIDAIALGEYNSNITAGLETAVEILDTVPENSDKNIVIVTTGLTNTGKHNYTGHYDTSTTGSTWYNTGTQISLYAYANEAYATADKAKEDTTIYSLGIFQTMENMPAEGENIAEFFKITARDLASSPSDFFEVTDPNNIQLKFDDIAQQITSKKLPIDPDALDWLPIILIILGILLLLALLLFLLWRLLRSRKSKKATGIDFYDIAGSTSNSSHSSSAKLQEFNTKTEREFNEKEKDFTYAHDKKDDTIINTNTNTDTNQSKSFNNSSSDTANDFFDI